MSLRPFHIRFAKEQGGEVKVIPDGRNSTDNTETRAINLLQYEYSTKARI